MKLVDIVIFSPLLGVERDVAELVSADAAKIGHILMIYQCHFGCGAAENEKPFSAVP